MVFTFFGELLVQLATWRGTFQIARSLQQLKTSRRLVMLLLRDETSDTNVGPSSLVGNMGAPLKINVEDDDSDGEDTDEVMVILVKPLETNLEMP
ncbi:hypothetical protein EIP86_009210 [Pleurotus ostreatoroseus]|nr:hypothetical protein EIP86_009210 [Pleurotus ostreatoroseus]